MRDSGITKIEIMVGITAFVIFIVLMVSLYGMFSNITNYVEQSQLERDLSEEGRTHRYRVVLTEGDKVKTYITDVSTRYKPVEFEPNKASFFVDGLASGFMIPINSNMSYTYKELTEKEVSRLK